MKLTVVEAFIPWKSANAKCHQSWIPLFPRRWLISPSLLAGEKCSDFTKTSSPSEQSGSLSGFMIANSRSQLCKQKWDSGVMSGSLPNPQDIWRRGIRKWAQLRMARPRMSEQAPTTWLATHLSPCCHWALDVEPGCFSLLPDRIPKGTCFLASLAQF